MNGTMIWIGDHRSREFTAAYEYCVDHVAQIALRHGFNDALARVATDVRWILYSETMRVQNRMDEVARCYPDAKLLTLLGPMCDGIELSSESNRYNCRDWQRVVPEFLGADKLDVGARCRSVAIVTQNADVADSLLGLAESAGVTAFWCRGSGPAPVRNIDAVWWDDSIATPTSTLNWRKRLDSFSSSYRNVCHAWLVHAPRFDAESAARRAGVDVVASKPFHVQSLLSMFDLETIATPQQRAKKSVANAA